MTAKYYVYMLLGGEQVFYVGKGSGPRMAQHERDARRGGQSVTATAIRDLWARGVSFRAVRLFESDDEDEVLRREKLFIQSLDPQPLVNHRYHPSPAPRPKPVAEPSSKAPTPVSQVAAPDIGGIASLLLKAARELVDAQA